jgi:hypothetical protein
MDNVQNYYSYKCTDCYDRRVWTFVQKYNDRYIKLFHVVSAL